jgi:vancomycin resistance protein YoaR
MEGVFRRRRRGLRFRTLAVLLVAVLGGAAAAIGVRWWQYEQHVLPGVRVAGVEVGGLSATQAQAVLERELGARLERRVPVRVRGRLVRVRPATALRLDAAASAAAALEEARGSFWTHLRSLGAVAVPERNVEPVLRIDAYGAAGTLKKLDKGLPAPRPAAVRMRGVEPVVVASKPGVRVARPPLLQRLRASALGSGDVVVAPLQDYEPPLRTPAADDAAATARRLVAEPVALTHGGASVGTLDRETLAKLLRFRARGSQLALGFDRRRLARVLRPRLAPYRMRATNARFVVSGTAVTIAPSHDGLDVDPWRAAAALASATATAGDGGRVAEITLRSIPADLTTEEAQALGIRERISSFTTEMGTSSSNRIHNVHLMADYIDGTIVKPGEAFSFNRVVGPRTEKRGFLEGQMIIGSLLVPSIGGGVCQTATTLFNNAFELGLPITERHNHSFYISHYPLGRDATVSWGGPDFGFRNDLEHAILIKTTYTDSTLTFSFYGTGQGRRVEAITGPKINWKQPTVSYALDPYAPSGSVRTVSGSNEPGFDVTVTRKIYEGRRLLRKDSFTSTYIAVGPTQIYGPGSSIPGSYFVLPRV